MSSNHLLKWTFGPDYCVLSYDDYCLTPLLDRYYVRAYGTCAPRSLRCSIAALINPILLDPQSLLTQLAEAYTPSLCYGDLVITLGPGLLQTQISIFDRGTQGGLI